MTTRKPPAAEPKPPKLREFVPGPPPAAEPILPAVTRQKDVVLTSEQLSVKAAADAFSAAHPEGAKTLLAKLLAERATVQLTLPTRGSPAWDENDDHRVDPPVTPKVRRHHSHIKGMTPVGSTGPAVQSTRMLKVVCGTCGYTVRTTRKWLDVGLPSCPDGDEMQEDV